ncbi:orotate phosphoribosyltransferase [Waterburya agarophytonicola K14]|uniref:Orotate phosphoribosyltransferase n=1 Tax=Waterburya agarophytonicola KI4 TaxID=2874699 RepID=A0A964BPR2_9CYAN|nr:orotate phosphoribosyltransferase [Waterburya agarophytonicola]MCC0177024.1 orotate phosphoribosyltransferase [Waterburya agarophytonicola KI4]
MNTDRIDSTSLGTAKTDTLRQVLLDLIVEYAYVEGDFLLSSGAKSSYYINCKEVTLRAEGALALGRLLFQILPSDTIAVAGLTLGADPMVSAVSVVSAYEGKPIPALIIRKKPKGHGTKAYIEGPSLASGAKIVVLEDVVTTGGSALTAVERLQTAGYEVTQILSLVDREQGGKELYQSKGIDFQALFSIREIQEY